MSGNGYTWMLQILEQGCTYQKKPVVTMAWSSWLLGSGTLSHTALLQLLLQQAALRPLWGSACWEGELQGAMREKRWTAEERICSLFLRCFWMAVNISQSVYEQIPPHCTLTLLRSGSCFLIYWNHSAPRGKGILPPPTLPSRGSNGKQIQHRCSVCLHWRLLMHKHAQLALLCRPTKICALEENQGIE